MARRLLLKGNGGKNAILTSGILGFESGAGNAVGNAVGNAIGNPNARDLDCLNKLSKKRGESESSGDSDSSDAPPGYYPISKKNGSGESKRNGRVSGKTSDKDIGRDRSPKRKYSPRRISPRRISPKRRETVKKKESFQGSSQDSSEERNSPRDTTVKKRSLDNKRDSPEDSSVRVRTRRVVAPKTNESEEATDSGEKAEEKESVEEIVEKKEDIEIIKEKIIGLERNAISILETMNTLNKNMMVLNTAFLSIYSKAEK